MSLLDTIDGSFMNFAYGWAFSNPVRKVYYNITITGLSVAVALLIGTVELAGLAGPASSASAAPFWGWVDGLNINTLGFVIVGLFAVTWAVAVVRLAGVRHRAPLREPHGSSGSCRVTMARRRSRSCPYRAGRRHAPRPTHCDDRPIDREHWPLIPARHRAGSCRRAHRLAR